MTKIELTTVYEKIKSLCISYGKTNIGVKALSSYTGISKDIVKECISNLLDTGALKAHVDDNHFEPNEISVGWDGTEPHRTKTRYFTLP